MRITSANFTIFLITALTLVLIALTVISEQGKVAGSTSKAGAVAVTSK